MVKRKVKVNVTDKERNKPTSTRRSKRKKDSTTEDEEGIDNTDRDTETPSTTSTVTNVSDSSQAPFQNPQFSQAMIQAIVQQLMTNITIQRPFNEEEFRYAALDKTFRTVPPSRIYAENEKLVGRQNYTTWLQTIRGDLKACNLLVFIDADQANGLVNISPSLRSTLDAQALQFIRLTLSKSASFTLGDVKTAFEAMNQIKHRHGMDKYKDMIEIDRKWVHLKFWPHYDQNRYVYEFNQLVKRFSEHNIVHPDEYLVIAFLQRMQGIFNSIGPLAIFYRQLTAENLDKIDLATVQARFVSLDLRQKNENNSGGIKRKHTDSKTEHKNRNNETSSRFTDTNSRSTSTHRDEKPYDRHRKFSNKPSSSNQDSNKSSSSNQAVVYEEPNKSQPVHMKYTPEQREKLKTMTEEEKAAVRCTKCGDYFHSASECKNKGRRCFICNIYGHEAKNCPQRSGKSLELKVKDFIHDLVCLLDSGASHTFVRNQNLLLHFKCHPTPIRVLTIENRTIITLESIGEGTLPFMLQFKSKQTVFKLKSVQCVPSARNDVMSVNHFNEQFHTSCILNVKSGFITSRKLKSKLATIQMIDRVYWLSGKVSENPEKGNSFTVCASWFEKCNVYHVPKPVLENEKISLLPRTSSLHGVSCASVQIKKNQNRRKLTPTQVKILQENGKLWHRIMGHMCAPYVNRLPKVTTGTGDLICIDSINNCTVCARAKQTRKNFDKDRERATRVGQIVHADLMGPVKPVALATRKRYIIGILDDFSRFLQLFTMKTKDQTPMNLDVAFREIQANYPGPGQFHTFRCDKGTEFMSEACLKVLEKYKVKREPSETNAHEHGGAAERVNRTVQDKTRSIHEESGFPAYLWGETVEAVCWIYNRSPHAALDLLTPYEVFYGKPPDISQLKIIGARCEVLDEKIPKGAKFSARAETQYLIGYTKTGYRVYNPVNKTVNEVCNLKIFNNELFKETQKPLYKDSDLEFEPSPLPEKNTENVPIGGGEKINSSSALIQVSQENSPSLEQTELINDWDVDIQGTNIDSIDGQAALFDIYPKQDKSTTHYDKELNLWTEIPISYKQAMSPGYIETWEPAINKEKAALIKHNVWEVVPKPKGKPILPVRWLSTEKADKTKKARLIVNGACDKQEYTKDETASPTPCPGAFRWFLAHVAKFKWDLQQLDVTNAYLHAEMKYEKYINIPPGFENTEKNVVGKLNKSLYGMPTSPIAWFEKVDKYARSQGFESTPREPCIFVRKNSSNPDLIIMFLVYVDDFLITGSDTEGIKVLLENMELNFDLRNLGFPSRFLGIQFHKQADGSLFINQESYVDNILKIVNMTECSPKPTPIVPISNHKIQKKPIKKLDVPYKSVVGYLQYLVTCTRIDLAHSVGYVARFQAAPQPLHWKLVKRILKYLKGTKFLGLRFDSTKSEIKLDAYADADFAAETTRKSTTGYIIRMYGMPVMWASRLQKSISESTSEAELKALCAAAHDIRFLRELTNELLYTIREATTIYEDNVGAIRHCNLYASRGRIRHLELCFFKAQEYVARGILKISKVSSEEQLADALTKPLLETPFKKLVPLYMDSK